MTRILDCYPRYQEEGVSNLNGYQILFDRGSQKKFLGRRIQEDQVFNESLKWLTHIQHFGLLPVFFRTRAQGDWVTVSPKPEGIISFYPDGVRDVSISDINVALFNFISGTEFLFRHGFFIRQFSVKNFLYDKASKGRLGYLEDIIPLIQMEPSFFSQYLNYVYLAPETLENQIFNASSIEFYLGQVLLHLLTGSPHYRERCSFPKFLESWNLKKDWKDLLWKMTEPLEKDRCGWNNLLKESARLAGYSRNSIPKARIFLLEDNQFPLPAQPSGISACVVQTGPGREGVYIRNQILDWCDTHQHLFLHLWQEKPSNSPYESVNQLIDLLRGEFLEFMGLSKQFQSLPRLTTWQSEDENKIFWKPVVHELKRTLFSGRYKGVAFLFEDLHHMDPESISAIATLISWLKTDHVLFAGCTPFFLDRNLKILRKEFPVHLEIKKPLRVSWESLSSMTDQFQKGRLKDYYRQIHADVHGNQTLIMNELQEQGSTSHFLEQIWRKLKPSWQRFFSLLSCSFQPLSCQDVESFMPRKDLPDQDLLERMGMIHFEPLSGFIMEIPAIRRFCRAQLTEETRIHISNKLRERENCGAFQHLCLNLLQENKEAALQYLMPAIDELLRTPGRLWFSFVDSEELETHDPEIARCLRLVRDLFFGRPTKREPQNAVSWLAPFRKGLWEESKGNLSEAYGFFRKSAGQREIPFLFKVKSIVKALNCSAGLNQSPGISRLLRQFEELSWNSDNEKLKPFFVAQIQSLNLKNAKTGDWSPGPWKNWPLACHAWQQDDFTACLYHVERVIENPPQWMDDLEWGNLFKLLGNSLFKNNHPRMAAKAYRNALKFFESSGQETAIWSVSYNLASTEKLGGDLLASLTHFHELLPVYKQNQDTLSETQVLFNLMELALLRGQYAHFEELYLEHRALCKKIKDPQEKARGLIVGLYNSFRRPKFMVEESLGELKQLMQHQTFDPLITQEAEIARRMAALKLNLPAFSSNNSGIFTLGRHQILDFLCGESKQSLHQILQQKETGFFLGLKIQLLVDAVEAGFLPVSKVPPFFMAQVKRYSQANQASFFQILQSHVEMSQTEQIHIHFKKNLKLYSHALEHPPGLEFLKTVLNEFQKIWPFESWGSLNSSHREIRNLSSKLPSYLEKLMKPQNNLMAFDQTKPFIRSWYSESGLSCEYLVLPVHVSFFWFCRLGIVTERPREIDLLMFQEILMQIDKRWAKVPEPKVQPDINPGTFPQIVSRRFIGESPGILEMKRQIALLGGSEIGVHITGESGTGKELVARLLHDVSVRTKKAFKAINCCDYSENLIQSELFGHVKGAFTGAERDRIGILEQINGGTLFLDEIGDLTPAVQTMLLRFLQEKEITRMGDNHVRKVDVRVITATNKSLQQLMDEGTFRPDLFFRIAETELRIPALRSRLQDIDQLVAFFIRKFTPDRKVNFLPGFLTALKTHSWPGNVRELEHYIKKTLIMCPKETDLGVSHMPDFVKTTLREEPQLTTLAEFEWQSRKKFILDRLAFFGGNRTKTAESLGITRQQLIRILKKLIP